MAAVLERLAGAAAQCGDWLSHADRVRALRDNFLVIEIAVFGFLVAGTHGWIVPLDEPNTTDFVSFLRRRQPCRCGHAGARL